ncbi:hypothetical protein ACJMK2_023155 [Sinanodonta woodiana]|uniref:Allorecognition 2 n=1 Tax=Sinanodonta woodiana TaxID=1069815 RepID=A0ABD3T3A2_SINWO
MTKDTFWIFAFYLPTVAVLTVAKGNKTLLEFFPGYSFMDQKTRLFIKYNNITEEVSLLINNVTRDDEGLYQISSLIIQKSAKGDQHISKTWNIQLNILEPSEIKQGNAGENILITELLQESLFFPRLYHNDQLIAVLRGSDCDVSTTSQFYGRIRCSKDKDNNTTRIEINHVTENDTGLYTVKTESSLTQRCFLNITGSFTNSVSELTSVNMPDRYYENNSDQPSNITLSATILSGLLQYFQNHSMKEHDTARNITLNIFFHTRLQTTVYCIIRNTFNVYIACVPVYVIVVIIGAIGFINLIGGLIWGQRRKIYMTKTEQHNPQDECDPGLYLTPILLESPLTLPTCQEIKTGRSNISQNKTVDQSTRSINVAQMLSKDEYEVVDTSNDHPAITPELKEIYESTENFNTPCGDTPGYLTVLA